MSEAASNRDRPGGTPGQTTPNGALLARLVTALLQAGGLYALFLTALPDLRWPATVPVLFIPLAMVATAVPLAVMLDVGRLPARWLVLWSATAALLLAGFGAWEVIRRGPGAADGHTNLLPSAPLVLALAAGFFAANVLVTDAVLERRWWPSYARHIDTAWKQALQAAFAALFIGLFWAVLAMGAGLFSALGLRQFGLAIAHPAFAISATTLALALSIHVTDVQPGLIRGARSVILALLSWLLPVLAVIVLGFLGTLLFTSLRPLWNTHFALALLAGVAACVIILINTAYGDGEAWSGSRFKRAAAMLGAFELLPLLGLAVVALLLRAGQYGWTTSRIFAAAGLVVVGCYALGYAAAFATRRATLLEATNHVTAYVGLALILLLFSPVADPARIAVGSQLARLRSGSVPPAQFDFAALRSDGARWGAAAVADLASGSGPVAEAARAGGDGRSVDRTPSDPSPLEPEQLAQRVKVLPPGRTLPSALVHGTFVTFGGQVPRCFQAGDEVCTVRFLQLVPNGPEVALLIVGGSGALLEQDAAGHWQETAKLTEGIGCDVVRQGLEDGTFSLAPHTTQDILVGGMRLTAIPVHQSCQ